MKICIAFMLLLLLCCNAEAKKKHSPSCITLLAPSTQSLFLQNQMINTMGLERIGDERRLKELVNNGTLVALPNNDAVKIAPSLPLNRRYALPMANNFLEKLASEYYAEFGLPLQINSAVRSKDVQKNLRRHNKNAAPPTGELASSHEAGTTLDISRRMSKAQTRWLEWRLLYYTTIGWAIVEEESTCFHIMAIKEIA